LEFRKKIVLLHPLRPDGGIGRRAGLKHQWIHFHAGSIPALGTEKSLAEFILQGSSLLIQTEVFFFHRWPIESCRSLTDLAITKTNGIKVLLFQVDKPLHSPGSFSKTSTLV
jgi:hypothetical protein